MRERVGQLAYLWPAALVALAFAFALQQVRIPTRLFPATRTLHTTPTAAMAPSDDNTQWFRLPADVRPVHYDLTILSDLDNLQFQGVVTAQLEVVNDTDRVQFNAAESLRVSKVLVGGDAAKAAHTELVQPEVDGKHERVSAQLHTTAPRGSRLSLSVAFAREIDASMMGYYHSTWEHQGRKGNYALTQFEPTSARRAFPCWDEPELKASYTVRMIHRAGTTALGNMPATSERSVDASEIDALPRSRELDLPAPHPAQALSKDSWTLTEFAPTPKVSSYLVAWANGEFVHVDGDFTSPLTQKKVPLRVYTTPEYIHQAGYALEVKTKVVPEYERIFDVAYPLPKLDTLVASDFDAGAMENWGLITGRTSVFLYDDKSGLQGRKLTASVQSHECAHMWFGNIATLAWWDNLWLNEAFATLMGEVIILDRVYPEWKSASEFIVSHLNRALDLDSKRSSHPIEVPLQGENVEDAINQVFDAISYSKGASVLRMLSRMLGEDVFLQGVSRYLKKHLYGSAVTRDLWNGISEASGKDVSQIMDNWVLKQGFPVLTVTEGENSIRVRQNRFLSTGDPSAEEDATVWHVPLALRKVGGQGTETDMGLVLSEREKEIPLENASGSVWKLNGDTIGVYRVAYSPEHLARLGEAAARPDGGISLEDRVGLVSDAFTLAQAGYSKTSGGMALMAALKGDESYLVNMMAAQNLGKLASVWWEQPEPVRSAIDKLRADVFGPMAQKLTFDFGEEDSSDLRELRTTVVSAAAAASDPWTLSQVKERFAPLRDHGDDSRIHPDLLRTVLSQAVKHGGESEYEAVLRVYQNPATPTHKLSAMLALGATRDPALLHRTIEFLFSNNVKAQDYMYFFNALSNNPEGRRLLWNTVKERFDVLTKKFEGNFSLAGLLKLSISNFSQDKDAADVEAFFKDRNTSKFSMSLAQGLDSIRSQTRWLERDAADVESWLRSNKYL